MSADVGHDEWLIEDVLLEHDGTFSLKRGLHSSAMFHAAMATATALVRDHQQKILLVAVVLMNVKILSGDELQLVLSEVEQ